MSKIVTQTTRVEAIMLDHSARKPNQVIGFARSLKSGDVTAVYTLDIPSEGAKNVVSYQEGLSVVRWPLNVTLTFEKFKAAMARVDIKLPLSEELVKELNAVNSFAGHACFASQRSI